MSQLVDIFTFVADTIKSYLSLMNSHWYTQVLLYIVLLGIVVDVLVTLRR